MNESELRDAIEKAFNYRGDITLSLRDGRQIEGYVFDRRADVGVIRLLVKDSEQPLSIPYAEIVSIAFTGRDTAAGKSFETWLKKYREKKAARETNIRLEPPKLD